MLLVIFIFLPRITFFIMITFLMSPRLMIWAAWSFHAWMLHVLLLLVSMMFIFVRNMITMIIRLMSAVEGIVIITLLFIYLRLSTKTTLFIITVRDNDRLIHANFVACDIFGGFRADQPISFFLWRSVSNILDIIKILFMVHLRSFSLAKGRE